MSTVRNVPAFTGLSSLLPLLPSATTMQIIEMNMTIPLSTDTITTPTAEASMVIPKLKGFLSILFNVF